jgi:hypothetical protein
VIEFYAEARDPMRPVVCFDESPTQLISETRQPILSGQAGVSVTGIYGRPDTTIAGTLDGVLTTPGGPDPLRAIWLARRCGLGLRRPVPAGFAQVEQRGAQLHDLCHQQRASRRL